MTVPFMVIVGTVGLVQYARSGLRVLQPRSSCPVVQEILSDMSGNRRVAMNV